MSATSSSPRLARSPRQPDESSETLLDLMIADEGSGARIDGVVIGTLEAVTDAGAPQVCFAASPKAREARSTVALTTEHVGREVALVFEGGDPVRPIVLGLMQPSPAAAEADGERIELVAEREIVLRCGDASLTLTRAGKVLIKGAFVLTDATGVNRIRGGSVQIN